MVEATTERAVKRVLRSVGVVVLVVAIAWASLNAWKTYQRVQRAGQLNENGRKATVQVDSAQKMSVVGEPYPGEAEVDESDVSYRNLLPWTGELQLAVESAKLAHSYGELGADPTVVAPVESGRMIVELVVRVWNVDAEPKQENAFGHAWFLITDFGLYVDGLSCGEPVGFDGTPDNADPMTETWYFALDPGEEAVYRVYYAVDDSLCTADSTWAFATGDFGRASDASAFRMGSASVSLGDLMSDDKA